MLYTLKKCEFSGKPVYKKIYSLEKKEKIYAMIPYYICKAEVLIYLKSYAKAE